MKEPRIIKKGFTLLFLFVTVLLILLPSVTFAGWTIEDVDAPKYFSDFYPRAIALDSADRPHIAYGGDYLYHAYYDGSGWQYETVDTSYGVGDCASIAIDSNDKVHISYYDSTNSDLKYTTNVSGAWVISTIDTQAYGETSVAIDSNNKVHISYVGVWPDNNLKYATNESGAWVISTITISGGIGEHNSIAIDSNNKVHISFWDGEGNGSLKYATNVSGSWVISTIDSSAGHTSITIDSNNKVHISYVGAYPNYNLRYATNASGTWVITIIDSLPGWYNSIAVDSNDKVHISYFGRYNDDLKHTTNASGAWVTTTIDSSGGVGIYTSIIIDSINKVHISYFDADKANLKYATNASGEWIISTIDSSGNVGHFSSIAIDSNNKVHTSYCAEINDDRSNLKYASNASGAWVVSTIDSSTCMYTSMAIDSNNKAHISYFDPNTDGIKYATNASGEWVISTIDNHAYEYNSIAIDSNNKVHISFYGYDDYDHLKYATNASGTWVISTIDSSEGVGEYNSIALDSNDKVHISYLDNYPYDNLKYATNASGVWAISTIDSSGVMNKTSIAIDSNDMIHISYFGKFNNPDGGIKYATNASGAWVISTIDSFGRGYSSIALDSNNKVHISYYDHDGSEVSSKLKYTTNAFGGWVLSTIDSPASNYSSIAIDSYDIVHISYNYGYESRSDLKHAYGYGQAGAPNISVSPPSFDFGIVKVGDWSSFQLLNITNTGEAGLEIGEISLTGSNPSEFLPWTLDQCSWKMIPPSDTCSFYMIFTPTAVGIKTANLIIPSNDPDTPILNVFLSGTGYSDIFSLLSPNGGEVVPSGSTYTMRWNAPPEAVKFTLRYSINNGATWKLMAKNITGTSYNWNVPILSNNKRECLVKVIGFNSSGTKVGEDTSDATFTIEVVKLTSPDGGEILQQGTPHTITWHTNGTIRPVANAKLFYTTNGGSTWKAIKTLIGNPGSHNWTIPNVSSSSCKVKVVLKDSSNVTIGSDMSDGVFTIQL
jgi:hypothetical protein